MTKKIDIASIPELNTSVGMHGSLKQKEVGGPLCLGHPGRHHVRSLRSYDPRRGGGALRLRFFLARYDS